MKLFLELFGVIAVLTVAAGTNKVSEMQLNFWREKLPSFQVPDSVATSLSPLTQEEVNTFAKIIKSGNLSFHATQFCNSANLLCFQSLYVTPARLHSYNLKLDDFKNEMKDMFNLKLDDFKNEMKDMFFSPKELREGGQITLPELYSPWKAFLPQNLSQLIPFATVALSDVVSSFGLSWSSNMTRNMNNTLIACEEKPAERETKTCTTSIEGMIEFVLSNFGSSDSLELAFHPAFTGESGKKARVRKVVERLSNRPPLSCHRLVYPYGVFYCHSINGTSIFSMELEVLDNKGNNYNATALCHPSELSKGSFYCHLILGDTLLWFTKDKH